MKRRRTTSGVPGSLRSQSPRPDFGELVRLLGTAAEENNSGLFRLPCLRCCPFPFSAGGRESCSLGEEGALLHGAVLS